MAVAHVLSFLRKLGYATSTFSGSLNAGTASGKTHVGKSKGAETHTTSWPGGHAVRADSEDPADAK